MPFKWPEFIETDSGESNTVFAWDLNKFSNNRRIWYNHNNGTSKTN